MQIGVIDTCNPHIDRYEIEANIYILFITYSPRVETLDVWKLCLGL